MIDRPIFSIATASRRNQHYLWFYKSLSEGASSTSMFEIIFVGPNPPLQKMPENFKHIYSNASPCQCIEIAVRNSIGEYVLSTGDDVSFSDCFIDRLYSYIQKLDKNRILISFMLYLEGKIRSKDMNKNVVYDTPVSPTTLWGGIGISPVFLKETWLKLGGLDKRFHSSYCDVDMQLRFYEYGMIPFFPSDCFLIETRKDKGPFKEKGWNIPGSPNCTLIKTTHDKSQKILDSLWVKDGKMSKKRLLPLEPFTEEELMICEKID